jgi:hypothetical protein
MRSRMFVLAVGGLAALAFTAPAGAGESGSDGAAACVLNTRLLPENEVRTAANVNDPTVESTATGHAQIKVRNDGSIEWKVTINNRDAETFVAGHIHIGPPTANGPVVQGLFSGSSNATHFVDSGSVMNATLAAALCGTPSAYYVNYHTTQDPVGATRGQLG